MQPRGGDQGKRRGREGRRVGLELLDVQALGGLKNKKTKNHNESPSVYRS